MTAIAVLSALAFTVLLYVAITRQDRLVQKQRELDELTLDLAWTKQQLAWKNQQNSRHIEESFRITLESKAAVLHNTYLLAELQQSYGAKAGSMLRDKNIDVDEQLVVSERNMP